MQLRVGVALVVVACAGLARAEPDAFVAPSLIERVAAPYPAEALRAGLSGTVVLELDVDDKGAVGNVSVKTPAGHGFDEAATAAVQKFRFAPATSGGAPVAAHVTYAYTFKLRTQVAPKAAAKATLRGGVFLKGTRAPLADGSVIAVAGLVQERTTVDGKGQFTLTLGPGKWHVIVSGQKARRFETDETLAADQVVNVRYWIEPSQYNRYESTVRADPNREEISRQTLTTEELMKMPGTMGDRCAPSRTCPAWRARRSTRGC